MRRETECEKERRGEGEKWRGERWKEGVADRRRVSKCCVGWGGGVGGSGINLCEGGRSPLLRGSESA